MTPDRFVISVLSELRKAILAVVFLAIDVATGTVKHPVKLMTFAIADMAIGFGKSLIGANTRLLGFEPYGFAARQFAATDSLIDAALFVALATIDVRRVGRCCNAQAQHKQSCQCKTDNPLHKVSPSVTRPKAVRVRYVRQRQSRESLNYPGDGLEIFFDTNLRHKHDE